MAIEMANYQQANVPRRYLYAALRNILLNLAGDKCDPLEHLDQINGIKKGEFEAEVLLFKPNHLFGLYEASKSELPLNSKGTHS